MPFLWNGSVRPTTINYNAESVKTVTYNGTVVWGEDTITIDGGTAEVPYKSKTASAKDEYIADFYIDMVLPTNYSEIVGISAQMNYSYSQSNCLYTAQLVPIDSSNNVEAYLVGTQGEIDMPLINNSTNQTSNFTINSASITNLKSINPTKIRFRYICTSAAAGACTVSMKVSSFLLTVKYII